MKKKVLTGSFLALLLLLFYSIYSEKIYLTDKPVKYTRINENFLVKTKTVYTALPKAETTQILYPPFVGKSINGFKEALGFKESRGNYFAVNSFGYLGKYQFGASTLRAIGVYNTTFFLNHPEIQEKAFIANLERNKWILRKEIEKFEGKKINGIKITESGMLAAAHLAGPGNVKRYLKSYGRLNFKDANGASVWYYMKKFSGYDLSHITAKREAKI